MRFSIKTLLAATALVAVSISGLMYANLIWAAAFFTAALVCVLFGMIAAIISKYRRRAFWIGFAVFGAGYFWMSMMTKPPILSSKDGHVWFGRNLITTHLLIWSEPWVSPMAIRRAATGKLTLGPNRDRDALLAQRSMMVPGFSATTTSEFLQVGHSIFTLLSALVGGALGSLLYRRATRER